jgi:hypothetical protein
VITIVALDTQSHELTRRAIELTQQALPIPSKVLTFSDRPIIEGETRVPILPIKGIEDYSELCLKHLWPYIDTDHFIIVQYDGFAVNGHAWDNAFLEVDYIGALWPWAHIPDGQRVGNGGFSLRSKKLIHALRDPTVKMNKGIEFGTNEDVVICRTYRRHLELSHGIKFATDELASKFSYEQGNKLGATFGMHGIWNIPLYCTKEDTELFLFGVGSNGWTNEKAVWSMQNCQTKGWGDLAHRLHKVLQKTRPDLGL